MRLGLVVALAGLLVSCISTEGPRHENATRADVVVTAAVVDRGTVEGTNGSFDTVVLDVTSSSALTAAAVRRSPDVTPRLEALDLDRIPLGAEVTAFLDHRDDGSPTGWEVVFALDTASGRPVGDFDSSLTRDALNEIVGSTPPEERAAAFVDWVRGPASQLLENQTAEDVAGTYFGGAVRGDVTADRPEPFDVDAWFAAPADRRLLPVTADDPALGPLTEELDLVGTALVVRPNAAFSDDVTHVALEVVDIGVLGWLELRHVPTGLVGATPLSGEVRVLGRSTDGSVTVLRLLSDRTGSGDADAIAFADLTDHVTGPRSIVIDLAPTEEDVRSVSLHTTTIDELGLLLERAGR